MILSRPDIKAAVDRGEIRFDPPLDERQWGDASVDLRLGLKFTKFKPTRMIVPLASGFKQLSDSLWHEETFSIRDEFGKRKSYCIEPDEFILAQTYEHIWIPRNLIARVEDEAHTRESGSLCMRPLRGCSPVGMARLRLRFATVVRCGSNSCRSTTCRAK